MIVDIGIHMLLEAMGAGSLRCVLGVCSHKHHRIAAWSVFALMSSTATVMIVG